VQCIYTVYLIINNFSSAKVFYLKKNATDWAEPLPVVCSHVPIWLCCKHENIDEMGHESTTRKEEQLGYADSCQMPMFDLLKMGSSVAERLGGGLYNGLPILGR
jgi:hypothetical protein